MKRVRDPDLVKRVLADRDLSHRELARLAECSPGTIGFVLAGKACNPELARRIARILRRKVDELFVAVESSTEQSIDQQEAVA